MQNSSLHKNRSMTCSLTTNISTFKQLLNNEATIVYRLFKKSPRRKPKYCLIFCNTTSSETLIDEKIISPIVHHLLTKNVKDTRLIDYIINNVLLCREVKKTTDINNIITSLLSGDTVLLIDGIKEALLISTREWTTRSVSEPEAERVVRGPREGFTESIKTNISLLRRKIVNPNLKFVFRELGTVTKTKVCICYLEGIANTKILEELQIRLNTIDIDGILDSGYIQELIKDEPLSPFKTIGNTERPDVVAGKLLEGRIALICDGSPSVLTLPFLFIEYFQASEDYYNNFLFASFNRLLRIVSFFLTTSIPSIYLAIVAFHQEMIPTPLLLSIAAARQGVPFPTVIETFLMGLFFELLKEAGVRLPTAIGQAISIVGALVLGQAAVAAKIVSAPLVIMTAVTGITSFLVPGMSGPILIIRILLLIVSSIFGMYGYIMGEILLFIYLMSIRSYGIPYMLAATVIDATDIKDTAIRAPWWLMYYRPRFISVNPFRKKGEHRKEGRQ